MRTARVSLAAVAAVALLALGATGAATAAPLAPAALSPQCQRMADGIGGLERARTALATALGRLQQQIASGRLRPAALRLARTLAVVVQRQLQLIDATIARQQARFAAFCPPDDGGGSGEEEGGEEEQPPPPPPSEE